MAEYYKERYVFTYRNKKILLYKRSKSLNWQMRMRSSDRTKSIYKSAYTTDKDKAVKKAKDLVDILRGKKTRLYKKYGITDIEYNKLLEKQSNRCGCCKRHRKDFNMNFAVDHCHKTGIIRGLLCGACNTAIGMLGDDVLGVLSAVIYLSS